MKTILLNISDIHYGSNTPENEGLVISAFVKDVEEQVHKLEYNDIYVLIGGDLVFAASEKSYSGFDKEIVQRLMDILHIGRDHFVFVPGNHDLNRDYIKDVEESFQPIFQAKYSEEKFNNLIRKDAQKGMLFGKFDEFSKFSTNIMQRDDNTLTCAVYNLNNKWSIHTLNSAILSSGGFNGWEDNNRLGIDSRTLNSNLASDYHPHKILLMHHPEYFCMDWVKHELKKLYASHFDLVLTGHTHDQDIFCQQIKRSAYIHCEAPQLYTDKNDDVLGYNFIEICDDSVTRIIYREWFEKRNRFRAGSAFVDDESGIETFEVVRDNTESQANDRVRILRDIKLRSLMESFVGQPYIWVERYLSDDRIDQMFKLEKSTMFSETDIINNAENIRIVAPSQYGLTCYGMHFLITLWDTKREFGVFVDADNIRTRKFEALVQNELETFGKQKEEVKWIVIDNWRPYKKDQNGISKYILQEFPKAHVILMSPFHERNFSTHLNTTEVLPIEKTLYLTPLKHEQERLIVDEYNKLKYIDESDAILNKLDEDLRDFNLHRTPYSCFTLLTVFKDSFDRNPVNRTSVLENILNIIFDNTKLPTYKNSNPDVKDCEFCLGYFCTQIIDHEYYFFTRDLFYTTIREFCEKKKTDININQLFDILCYNRIIIEESGQYTFRFTFWVYYFVASWMHVDATYAEKMLDKQNYQRYPEVLEFYTGKDRKRLDAVLKVTEDLKIAASNVQQKLGIAADKNPFAFLRFKNDKEQNEKIIKEIESTVKESNLPQSIKDQVADVAYKPSAAFHQDICKVYSDFSVGYLVNIISIASKVLRNSDHLDADVKLDLLGQITNGLKVFSNIIYLVSHLFAKQGYIDLPEYGLKLTEGFNNYDEDEKRIQIIVTIPYNLMMMFKEDLYSRKLSPVYLDKFKTEKDKVEKHLLASFIVYKQPEGWESVIKSYLDSVGKDSYYLGTITDLMYEVYYLGELDTPDRMRMNNLIKSAIYKADHGVLPPSLASINHQRLKKAEDVIKPIVSSCEEYESEDSKKEEES